MNKTPKISVVLPVYNGIRYLEESVMSVLNQDTEDYEFLICDDCSTDGSYEYLKQLKNSKIKLFRNERNLGLFPTLNRLIKAAKSPLIHLWAQDDLMMPNCLSETIKFHQKFTDINFSFSRMYMIDENGKVIKKLFEIEDKVISPLGHAKSSILYGSIAGNIANVTLVKSAVEKVGYFNESMKYAGDFEMWCKLSKDKPVGMSAGYLIKLRVHSGQLSKNLEASYYKLKENIEVYKCFLSHFKGKHFKIAIRALKWKIYPQYFNQYLVIKRKGKKDLAKKYKKGLKSYGNLLALFLRWLIIRILRLLKLEQKFYQKFIISKF